MPCAMYAQLAVFPSLHTLILDSCDGVRDVSGLAACPSLHTLTLKHSHGVRDMSGLTACSSLHTLTLKPAVACATCRD